MGEISRSGLSGMPWKSWEYDFKTKIKKRKHIFDLLLKKFNPIPRLEITLCPASK